MIQAAVFLLKIPPHIPCMLVYIGLGYFLCRDTIAKQDIYIIHQNIAELFHKRRPDFRILHNGVPAFLLQNGYALPYLLHHPEKILFAIGGHFSRFFSHNSICKAIISEKLRSVCGNFSLPFCISSTPIVSHSPMHLFSGSFEHKIK